MQYIITRADGEISLGITDSPLNDLFEKWQQSAKPEWLPATIDELPGDLPTDRRFRGAWRRQGNDVAVHMSAARQEHLERIRMARDAKLHEKDAEQLRALGRGDNAERDRVENEKQVLRDLPANITGQINSAQDPDALEAVWPAELGPR